MSRTVRRFLLALPSLLGLAALPAAAQNPDAASGGAAFSKPAVSALSCPDGAKDACPRGAALRIEGENLDGARSVVFLGRSGTGDDRRARPTRSSAHRVVVTVPSAARTGAVQVATASGTAAGPRLRVLASRRPARSVAANGEEGVFPVRGKHDFGTATNGFGGGRGHEGHDVFAACGTPLVAAMSGVVTMSTFQSNAGNYVVVTAADGTSQAYMHMQRPSALQKRDRVAAGERIGLVGQTGRASGCHLHFEFWTAPGWYAGGEPIDPLSRLRAWDRRS